MFLIITSVTNCDFIISKKRITLVTKCDYSLPIKKNTSDKNGKWSRDKNKILGDRKFFIMFFHDIESVVFHEIESFIIS